MSQNSKPTSNWKDIESAPRDGTEFLAHNGKSYAVCHWDTMEWAKGEPCVFPLSDAVKWMPLGIIDCDESATGQEVA